MSFAKRAADELLSDSATEERETRRARLRNLLISAGVLAAGAGGAYYLGKDGGENWKRMMAATGMSAKPEPTSGAQHVLDKATNSLGFTKGPTDTNPNREQTHSALVSPTTVGTLGGTGLGAWAASRYGTEGRTLGGVAGSKSDVMSAKLKELNSADNSPTGKKIDIAHELNQSTMPVPATGAAPTLTQARAFHTGGPLTPSGTGAKDLNATIEALKSVHSAPTGAIRVLPNGTEIHVDALRSALPGGRTAGTLAQQLEATRGVGRPGRWWNALGGLAGGLAGGYTGSKLDSWTMPPAPPQQ